MKRVRAPLMAFSLLLSLSAALAVETSRWGAVPSRDHARSNPFVEKPEAAAAGAHLYRDHCQQCHGSDAQGDGKKKPSLRAAGVRTATDGDLEWFLRQGDLRHGMPSWSSLPQGQRWEIIAYLRSLP
jgi:mono/diheme cytochrome c family protein